MRTYLIQGNLSATAVYVNLLFRQHELVVLPKDTKKNYPTDTTLIAL